MRRGAARPGTKAEVTVLNPSRFVEASAAKLRPWLQAVLAEVAPRGGALAVRLAGERTLRRLNRSYRGRDEATDVLSFPGQPGPDGLHLGDVVIGVPVARRQAVERRHSSARELRLLALHGLLHCMGYDHETDRGEMARLERRLRRRWLDRD